jgi:hypothetical protein
MESLTRKDIDDLHTFALAGELDRVVGVLVNLDSDGLAELKAFLWIANREDPPKYWDALVIQARQKIDRETPLFIAGDERLAEKIVVGIEIMENAGRL